MASVVDINDLDFDFGVVEDSSTKKENTDFGNGNVDFFSDPFSEKEFSSGLSDNPDLEGKCNDENVNKELFVANEDNVPLTEGKRDVKILKYDEIFGDDPFKEDSSFTNQPVNGVTNEFDPFSPKNGNQDSSNFSEVNQELGFKNQFDSNFTIKEIGDTLNNNPQKLPDLVLSENLPIAHNVSEQSSYTEKETVTVSISDVPILFDDAKDVTEVEPLTSQKPDHVEQNEKEYGEETVDLSRIMSSLKDQAQDLDAEFDFELAQNHKEKNLNIPNDTYKVKDEENQNEVISGKTTEDMQPATCSVTQNCPTVRESPDILGENQIREDDGLIVSSSAVTEWENVETIQPEFKGEKPSDSPQVRKSGPLYTFDEAYTTLQQVDYTKVKPNIKSSVDRSGLAAFVHFVFGPPKLHRDLMQNRDFVFCLSASSFDEEQPSHSRMLQTIYRLLTGSRFDSPRYGPHWEEIGFQGRDPSTDLRGVGVLGLVQLLYFLQHNKYGQIARDIYKLSLHPTQNFPFCVMGMNISRICLQSLREDILNKEINRRNDVMVSLNDFYVGSYLHMYKIWKMGRTIADSGYVLKDVEMFAKKRSKDIYKNLEQYLINGDGKTTKTEKGDEFFSVC